MKYKLGERVLLYFDGVQHRGVVEYATRDMVRVRVYGSNKVYELADHADVSRLSKIRYSGARRAA